jgi:hypothetical protein
MATETVQQQQRSEPLVRRTRMANEATLSPSVRIPSRAFLDFAEMVYDVSRGIETIADILRIDAEQKDTAEATDADDTVTILAPVDRESLERFVATSAGLLSRRADDIMKWVYETHTPEGRANRLRRAASAVAQDDSSGHREMAHG